MGSLTPIDLGIQPHQCFKYVAGIVRPLYWCLEWCLVVVAVAQGGHVTVGAALNFALWAGQPIQSYGCGIAMALLKVSGVEIVELEGMASRISRAKRFFSVPTSVPTSLEPTGTTERAGISYRFDRNLLSHLLVPRQDSGFCEMHSVPSCSFLVAGTSDCWNCQLYSPSHVAYRQVTQ